MNFTHLFTTARVLRATYQVVSTTLLLYYLAKRLKEGKTTRHRTRLDYYRD